MSFLSLPLLTPLNSAVHPLLLQIYTDCVWLRELKPNLRGRKRKRDDGTCDEFVKTKNQEEEEWKNFHVCKRRKPFEDRTGEWRRWYPLESFSSSRTGCSLISCLNFPSLCASLLFKYMCLSLLHLSWRREKERQEWREGGRPNPRKGRRCWRRVSPSLTIERTKGSFLSLSFSYPERSLASFILFAHQHSLLALLPRTFLPLPSPSPSHFGGPPFLQKEKRWEKVGGSTFRKGNLHVFSSLLCIHDIKLYWRSWMRPHGCLKSTGVVLLLLRTKDQIIYHPSPCPSSPSPRGKSWIKVRGTKPRQGKTLSH